MGGYPVGIPKQPAGISRIYWIELLCCILIIAALAAMAATIYGGYRKMAQVSAQILSALGSTPKIEMAVYHALTGDWPQNIEQVQSQPWSLVRDLSTSSDRALQAITIKEKTLVVQMTAPFEGHVVTVRPAVPERDPLGPVVWFAGTPLHGDGWHIEGMDQTNVPLEYISPTLR
ncbi:MAG: hypothetical protein M0036_23880 [Desulfobacteraceae bacterium]|nr:hypothetical protein [Desulfobacteraceae bacterium]